MLFSSIGQQLMLPQLVNTFIEQGVNYLIQRSDGIYPYLQKLNGKVLSVAFKQGGKVYLIFSAQQVDFLANYEGEPDCIVNMDIGVILQRPQKSQLAEFINRQQIVFQGDLQVLQDTVALFEQLEKDPEELLAPYLGDVAAYTLHRVGCEIRKKAKKGWQISERHWGERLTEEWQVIAPSLALVNFYDQVKNLEQDVQRLETKIERLLGKI